MKKNLLTKGRIVLILACLFIFALVLPACAGSEKEVDIVVPEIEVVEVEAMVAVAEIEEAVVDMVDFVEPKNTDGIDARDIWNG